MIKRLNAFVLALLALVWLTPPAYAQNSIWNPSCRGNAGGIVGQTYGGVLCNMPVNANVTASASVSTFQATGRAAIATVGTTSQAVPLGSADTTALVMNQGSNDEYIVFGGSGATASVATSYLVPHGWGIAFNTGGQAYIAAITASGTSSLVVTTGTGLPALTGGGGGGGGSGGAVTAIAGAFVAGSLVDITNMTATPGSDATKAAAVQGVTGGKPVSTAPQDVNGLQPDFSLPVDVQTDDAGSAGNSLNAATSNAVYVVQVKNGKATGQFDISGITGSGAVLTLEGSVDGGAHYRTINEIPLSGVMQGTITADGSYPFVVGAFTHARVRVTTTGSGTITVSSNLSTASSFTSLLGNLPDTVNGDLASIRVSTTTSASNSTSTATNTGKTAGAVATDGGTPPANNVSMGAWANGTLNHLITCDKSKIYDANSSGEVQIIAATASKAIYICGWHVESPSTVTVSLDDFDTVSTHTKITPAWNLSVTNPGNADVSPFWRGVKVAAGHELDANISLGVAVQLIVYYTVQP
jgi:hypothetical protein